jgi:ABC-type Na+ efflux pump permease subunit
MLKENEVVMMLLGIGVLFFILVNKDQIKRIKSWKTIIWAYYLLLFGWFFTILEGFFMQDYVNMLEHVSYLVSAFLLMIWCWRVTNTHKEEKIS